MGLMRRCSAVVVVLFACGLLAASSAIAANPLQAHGSAEQVWVDGLPAHAKITLLRANRTVVYSKDADSLGGILFRNISPGTGYRVRLDSTGQESGPLTVHTNADAPWDPSIDDQKISDCGYQYLTTRDGTKLAIDVHPPLDPADLNLPTGCSLANPPAVGPPYPTLIEYSGYGYADPSGPVNGIAEIFNLLGFAVVDVSMRGTGCSGGAFSFFEPLQDLDGYDVIQTIAHQPWVLDHKVGMEGISYGGITDLFTAQTDPPALEAIAPLSVIDQTETTLYPGGLLNTGFAVPWSQGVAQGAEPATATTGMSWAYQLIKGGDATCARNQEMHGEAENLGATIKANSHFHGALANMLAPTTFVHKIKAPVFMDCQFEDEQVGGHCTDLLNKFTGTKQKWFTLTNGAHIDSLDPDVMNRLYDFLSLFVGHSSPVLHLPVLAAAAPIIYDAAMGIPGLTLPVDTIQALPYKLALAEFEKTPQVTVAMDSGAGTGLDLIHVAGDPYPGYTLGFSKFPIPGTVAQRWYMGRSGSLNSSKPTSRLTNWFNWSNADRNVVDFGPNTSTGGLWGNALDWSWDWKQHTPGTMVSYITAPLRKDTTVIGGGAVDVWVKSATPNVDLQATISEVTPQGKEVFVQNGWIRGNERALDPGSTALYPVPSLIASQVRAFPKGKFVLVQIPLFYEGHAYRAGSRIRVTIEAPGGSQPIWAFNAVQPHGTDKVSIELSPSDPSSLVLPVIPGLAIPTPLPACGSLRNEPCRAYVPFTDK
jgi:predicted acyl esterase